jgi:hypothetical protein
MADTFPPAGPAGRTGPRIGKPGYPKPIADRLDFADRKLAEIEKYIAPNSAVMASLFIRAMLARSCTTAEAMWAVYKQVESGRYRAYELGQLPTNYNYIVCEGHEPSGLEVAGGRLHIDGGAGDWGTWVLVLPQPTHQAPENPFGIDSTPTLPKPPAALIQAAEFAICSILANVEPDDDRTIELIASHLVQRLKDAKHTLAAAQWAIHEAIQTGRLRPGLVETEMPSFLPRGSTVWQGGQRGTIAIPKGKPTPFDSFKVTATESLWTWWCSIDATHLRQNDRTAQPQSIETPMTVSERPSPFTIPDPSVRFADGPESEQRSFRSMTVGGLIHNLTVFADFFERASADIERVAPVLEPGAVGQRDANAESMQRDFRATRAIERVRAYVLAQYGAELTIGTARRLLGNLIRECGLTVEAAEGLSLEAAMDKLDAVESYRDQLLGGVAEEQVGAKPRRARTEPIQKRSTEPGEGRAKLIATLTKHHAYADGSCLNQEYIGNNELARKAGVKASTASAFFKAEFGGHTKYRNVYCRDQRRLNAALRKLREEYTVDNLFGGTPPAERERSDG